MFNLRQPNTAERHDFLDNAQQEVFNSLEHPGVVNALGVLTAARLRIANELLVIPNIRGDRLIMPEGTAASEAVPYIALWRDETFVIDDDLVLPTPGQLNTVANYLSPTFDDSTQIEGYLNGYIDRFRAVLPEPISIEMDRSAEGQVLASSIHTGSERADEPSALLMGRPKLGLPYARNYAPSFSLLHELIHVDQYFRKPMIVGAEEEIEGHLDTLELEAIHVHARYGKALSHNKLKPRRSTHQIIMANILEGVRHKHADPDNPYELTQPMRKNLKRFGYHCYA